MKDLIARPAQFNYEYAADVFDLVSKMDDGEAQLFAQMVGSEVLAKDIENNQRVVKSLTAQIMGNIRDSVAKSLLTDDSQEALVTAALVGTVIKSQDNPDTPYWDARDKSGRFSSGNGVSRTSVTFTREKTKRSGDRKARRMHANHSPSPGDFNLTSALHGAGGRSNAFSDEWTRASSDGSTNSQTYGRIQAGSRLLGSLPGGPKTQAAAQLGEFVGRYGPEAEKVVGPSIRSTAYRYRGTERKIDPNLVNIQRASVIASARHAGVDRTEISPAMREQASKAAAIQYFMGGQTIDGERIPGRLPRKDLSELQASSGKLPPSEGVIIDANGKITTQATGYMEDHYLPFNLKNLKSLKNGSYVRTRSSGGLTTEDIYTGLMSGADSVTVVSRSGVFTINFDKDFKGGRRYNDKARRMVSQYAKTLDAIKSEQVNRRGLSPDERVQIRDDVENEMGSWASQKEINERIKERETEFKTSPELTKTELDEIDSHAKNAYPDDDRKRKIARMELIDARMEEKAANKYRLDGEGYATALRAMKEQFPYYIDSVDVHYRDPKNPTDFTSRLSTESDRGYVKPRHNRPEGVKEGFYDTSINGHGKISADRTNFQNYATHRKVEDKKDAKGEEAKPKVAPKANVKANIAHARAQNDADAAQLDLVKNASLLINGSDTGKDRAAPMLSDVASGQVKLSDIMADPAKKLQLDTELAAADQTILANGNEDQRRTHEVLKRTYDIARKQVGGKEFNPDSYRFGDSPDVPFSYQDGPAYDMGSDPKEYQAEWSRLEKRAGLEGHFNDQSDDEDLQKAASFAGSVVQAARAAQGPNGVNQHLYQVLASNAPDTQTAVDIANRLQSPSAAKAIEREYLQKTDAIERMRRVKSSAMDSNAQEPTLTPMKSVAVPPKFDRTALMTELRRAADAYSSIAPEKASTYNAIYQAVRDKDHQSALEYVDELPDNEQDLWREMMRSAGVTDD